MSRKPPPPLPGGWKAADLLYFTAPSETVKEGYKLVHGQQGEVVGPATNERHVGKGVDVLFPGNKGAISCYLTAVSREPPPQR